MNRSAVNTGDSFDCVPARIGGDSCSCVKTGAFFDFVPASVGEAGRFCWIFCCKAVDILNEKLDSLSFCLIISSDVNIADRRQVAEIAEIPD